MNNLTEPSTTTVPSAKGNIARNTCGNMLCGKKDGLKNCSKCKSVAYCSFECQRLDWKTRHKSICSVPASDLTETDVNQDMSIFREVMKRVSFDQLTLLTQPDYCIVVQNEGENCLGSVLKFEDAITMLKPTCSISEQRAQEMANQCCSRQGNFIYVVIVHDRSNVRTYTLRINKSS
uniref:MYND-type zinc finger protein n=1 Tax=Clandestinovirus TaxID=2831644 RepID=A0A8F8PMJ0_9VIRU|nr:MYND-type zinc finger protein [Clandestinovirus]